MSDQIIRDYLSAVEHEFQTGKAREHSYRHACKTLLEQSGGAGYQAINEPAHIECGAPDYVVDKGRVPVGYVEAKDIGVSLDDVERTEQFKRYLQALGNLIVTNYLEFRHYVEGEKRLKDRKGRELSYDDIEHYRMIVGIVQQTKALMAQVDHAIEKHGGWPLA